jgi:hypothetical protein
VILKVDGVPFPICLAKPQQPSKCHKVNFVMHSLCHPVNDIYMAVIEEGSMKLSNDLSILVILEAHQVLHLILVHHLKCFLHL